MNTRKPFKKEGFRPYFRIIAPAYPAFNTYSRIADITASLGPVSIATGANQLPGWDVEMIDENNYHGYGPVTESGYPDHGILQILRPARVVGLYGGLTSTVPRLYEIARLYKEMGVFVIAGGQHFVDENIGDALQNGIDLVVLGEGEETVQELLTTIENGKTDFSGIAGVAFLKDGKVFKTPERLPIVDFDQLPLPDFSLVRYAIIKLFPLNWTRGCGMNCEFCTVKSAPRPASVHRVFRNFVYLVEEFDARRVFVVDDLFGQNRKEALELLKLIGDYLEEVGLHVDLTVQIRLDRAKDTELLKAMRRAQITQVCIGLESPIEEELLAMDKRLKPQDMVDLARLYNKAGFHVHGMFIFGYPLPTGKEGACKMPTMERVRRFRKFIKAARIDTIQVLLPVPLPGTEMTARLRAQNRVFPTTQVGWEYYDGNFPLFQPDAPVTPEEMHEAMKKIMGRFYQFKYMFAIGYHVMTFPKMVFYLHNLRTGWKLWYRRWRNSIMRFAGWIIIQRWKKEFVKGRFSEKLGKAKSHLASGAGAA